MSIYIDEVVGGKQLQWFEVCEIARLPRDFGVFSDRSILVCLAVLVAFVYLMTVELSCWILTAISPSRSKKGVANNRFNAPAD